MRYLVEQARALREKAMQHPDQLCECPSGLDYAGIARTMGAASSVCMVCGRLTYMAWPDRATLARMLRESGEAQLVIEHCGHRRECGPVEAAWNTCDDLNWFVVEKKHRRIVRLSDKEKL